MIIRCVTSALFIIALATPAARAAGTSPAATRVELQAIAAGAHRSAANKVRDKYRHPVATLAFFGVRPDATVVEIWPAGGYWTEILAPYLRDHGHYIAAVGGHDAGVKKFTAAFGSKPELYGKITVTGLDAKHIQAIAPDGTADFVLTFRNVHNWMKAGHADDMFAAFYKVLKKGGTLGLVEHRAEPTKPQDPQAASGYVREDYVIALAKKAGFTVIARADINANPKDTKDYAQGVWTLPPTLRRGAQDKDKYLAIGESDRMTLLFRK